jgi:N-acyl-D-amino-acid deacylase
MPAFDVIVKDGMVIDGTGSPRYRADIGIRDGVIAEIGRLPASDGGRVLDASGLNVAPGFVDLHTHYDAQLFWDPYCTISGWHGVTTVVTGNCGFGLAPVAPEMRDRSMLSLTRVEAIPYESMAAALPWSWETFPEFLDAVDRQPKSVNVQSFLPLTPLLIWVLGLERAKAGELPTDAEHRELRRLLHEALDAGACGWAAQRTPPTGGRAVQRDFDGSAMVTDVMHFETMRQLAEVLGERSQGFIQLVNTSGNRAADQAEFEELARVSGRPVLYNLVVVFDHQPEAHRMKLEWLDRCRREGLRVWGQGVTTDAGFTFTFEEWNLFDECDAWREATVGPLEERLHKLGDPARRPALREQKPSVVTCPIEEIVLVGPRTPETEQYRDLSMAEIGRRTGKDPVDAMLDIAVADGLRAGFYAKPTGANREYLAELLSSPSLLPGVSDGGAHTKFLTSGRYPTEFLVELVRNQQVVDLEQAHHRLSALPAACAGLGARGTLVEGAPADIVVYDFEGLSCSPIEVLEDLPGGQWRRVQRAHGYRWVLVNGEVTIEDDQQTGTASGSLLRHRSPRPVG